ncbi:MAG: hypothetical protein QOG03_1274 [Actinomycetota bacterium]|jgi:DUF4097 and DUF4098 domain-containing protein YvlB|nr:hypothetical protein [Actinomycetota bacterium]
MTTATQTEVISVRAEGGTVAITGDTDATRHSGEVTLTDDSHLSLHVAPKSALSISCESASVTVRNVTGPIVIRTESGDVVCEGAGSLDIATESGDVSARSTVGAVVVRTENGDVAVDGAGGLLDVATESGDVRARGIGHAVVVRTNNSDVALSEAGASVDIATESGDVEVVDVGGVLVVRTESGNVVADTVGGGIDIGTESGDIVGRLIGANAVVRTEAGDITLDGKTCSIVDAETESGDAYLDLGVEARACSARSEAGNVTVRLARGAGADVILVSESGEVVSTATVVGREVRDDGQNRLEGRIGDGGCAIDVHTESGDITLLEASSDS